MFAKPVTSGQQVMTQGADGDNFYVIESGTFEAVKDGVVVFTYNNSGRSAALRAQIGQGVLRSCSAGGCSLAQRESHGTVSNSHRLRRRQQH